jgi:hypothetical protein
MYKPRRQRSPDSQGTTEPLSGRAKGERELRAPARSGSARASEPGPCGRTSVRRRRARFDSKAYEVDSDLSPELAVTLQEIDALARLLGPDLDRFLRGKTEGRNGLQFPRHSKAKRMLFLFSALNSDR